MSKLLISILGQDQPGILATVAGVINTRDGNVENVSQTLLQNLFGALFIISVPETENPKAMEEALVRACRHLNLFIHVDQYQEGNGRLSHTESEPYIVTANGPDRQGLVAEISSQLARHEVNITNMQAIFKGGDASLDNLMVFEVDVPRHTVMSELRVALNEISERLSLEIGVQHRGIFESVSKI